MSEIRDGVTVREEQVAAAAQAVAAAVAANNAEQEQAGRWLDGGLSGDGVIVTPGPRQHE